MRKVGSKNIVLSDKEKEEIVLTYQKEKSIRKVSRIYSINEKKIKKILSENGIDIFTVGVNKKYIFNRNFFDLIDSEEKAYFLGLLYADGYNNEKKAKIELGLGLKDIDIIEKFNTCLESTHPILIINSKNDKWDSRAILVLADQHFSKTLSLQGCMQNKTLKIEFPTWLDESLYRHFIRGYLDGDGYIGKNEISIVGTENICKEISKIIKIEVNCNSYIFKRHKDRDNKIYTIRIGGRIQTLRFLNWIYENSTVYMNRKYQKYLIMKNLNINTKYINHRYLKIRNE